MDLTQSACSQMLGIPENAPLEDVRRAYRKLARRLHPDVAGGDSVRFSEITAAYNVLTGRCAAAKTQTHPASGATPPRTAAEEAEHAQAYAEFRRRAANFRSANGSRAPQSPQSKVDPIVQAPGAEPQVARAGAPEAVEVPVSTVAAAAPRPSFWQRLRAKVRKAAPAHGSDVYLTMPVDLAAILRGSEQAIMIQRAAACPSCVGGGDTNCVCLGAGRLVVREKLKVQVPAGARAGVKMRLAGKGNDGLMGRGAGDLYLLLEPAPIAGFVREGADLRGTLEVGAELARVGGPMNVPTPWGPLRLDVPAATRTGMKFRLRGQGLPVWQRAERGDLYLQVQVG
jgi:molecular chaperone DnaJ